jgi:uncharacterized protein YjbI with pentapeptide repeats
MMSAPEDADIVLTALKLGWCVAEVRGRNRLNAPAGPEASLSDRADQALLLPVEQTPVERRLQAQAVMSVLAGRLGVDSDADGSSFASRINVKARTLAILPENDSGAGVQWNAFTKLIYRFDAHIQSVLTAKSEIQADGYLLGRGLAECYWSLDPGLPDDASHPSAWRALFSDQRCKELSRLLVRLSDYMKPHAAAVIAGSLEKWKAVAANPQRRQQAQTALYEQLDVWYELTALGTDAARRPAWAGRRRRIGERPQRDWVAITASSLPGLAAVIALIFTFFSVQATKGQLQATQHQLQVAEQGQITDRYNAAIANLGSNSIDIRLGGIYALQRLMQDSPRDQPTVIAVLCAFARDPAASKPQPQESSASSMPTDVQAALTVVGTRNTANDGRTTVIDLNHALLARAQLEDLGLSGADLSGADLADANLSSTDLAYAKLTSADLSGADLNSTRLAGADLSGANLTGARLTSTDLTRADLRHVNLTGASFFGVNLSGASLFGANLAGAVLPAAVFAGVDLSGTDISRADLSSANLTHGYLVVADLAGATFIDADLSGADLFGANFTGADLTHATLKGANLSYADLAGAKLLAANLTGANLTGANLAGTYWPVAATVPGGWQRNPRTGDLARAAH